MTIRTESTYIASGAIIRIPILIDSFVDKILLNKYIIAVPCICMIAFIFLICVLILIYKGGLKDNAK